MKIEQHIKAGKLTGVYLSSWNNELTLSFGDDKIEVKMDESSMRDLHSELTERLESVDQERLDKAEAALLLAEEVEGEVDA